MTTAADYEPELVDALNLLIEDERASVEMEVALASGATEYTERETLARMGADDIRSCETLRSEMESAGLPVTPQINGVVFEVLGAERYDDRLRAFAHHQRIVADRASDLLESNLEGELRSALVGIVDTHQRHIEWVNRRADEFAATRLIEFGSRHSGQPAGATVLSIGPDASASTPKAAAPEAAAPEVGAPLPEIAPPEIAQEEEPADSVEQAPAEEALAEEAPEEAATPAPAEPPATEASMLEMSPEEAAAPEAPEAPEPVEASIEAPAEPATPRPRRGRPRKSVEPAE